VVACYAFNDYFGKPLSDYELLQLTAECEGGVSGAVHYDNVAPSLVGGLLLMLPQSPLLYRPLPWFSHWKVVLCYPGTVLSTKAAREVLPQELSLKHSIAFAGNLARFVSALYAKDETEAFASLQDLVAEPARLPLIPELSAIRAVLMAQGIGHVGISGAGPTLFAVCQNDEQAEFAAAYFKQHYEKNQDAMTHICTLEQQGARVLSNQSVQD
jgi:homoserine kinase